MKLEWILSEAEAEAEAEVYGDVLMSSVFTFFVLVVMNDDGLGVSKVICGDLFAPAFVISDFKGETVVGDKSIVRDEVLSEIGVACLVPGVVPGVFPTSFVDCLVLCVVHDDLDDGEGVDDGVDGLSRRSSVEWLAISCGVGVGGSLPPTEPLENFGVVKAD